MPGGKGKSTGGKAGPKEVAGKTQKSHSAKAGLQVSLQEFGTSGVPIPDGPKEQSRVITANFRATGLFVNAPKEQWLAQGQYRSSFCRCVHLWTRRGDCGYCAVLSLPRRFSVHQLTSHSLTVPMRSCQAFSEEQHSKQDACRSQRYALAVTSLLSASVAEDNPSRN